MLTINRPFYEYRDIYLFIAVGLATFITTFVVLGVVSTINIDQLSRSTSSEATSVEKTTSDTPKDQSDEQNKSSGGASSNDQSRQNPTTSSGQRAAYITVPSVQSSSAPAPQASAPSPQPISVGTTSTTPVVIVQQPAPSTPSNSGSGSGGGGSLINLPTNILPPLPLVGGLVDL